LTHLARLLKKSHLLRSPHPSSLQRTARYASLLMISGALHLAFFEQPEEEGFFFPRHWILNTISSNQFHFCFF
jgi:hypothetical protein